MWKRSAKAPLMAGLAGTALALCGCANIHNGISALKAAPPAAAEVTPETTPTPAIKTVKRKSTKARPDDQAEADQPAVQVAGMPTPAQIFRFRGANASMAEWRAPFIIAEDDGPLTAYVRNSARELRDFKASVKTREAVGGDAKSCGEAQVAARMPGCLPAPRNAGASSAAGTQARTQ